MRQGGCFLLAPAALWSDSLERRHRTPHRLVAEVDRCPSALLQAGGRWPPTPGFDGLWVFNGFHFMVGPKMAIAVHLHYLFLLGVRVMFLGTYQ